MFCFLIKLIIYIYLPPLLSSLVSFSVFFSIYYQYIGSFRVLFTSNNFLFCPFLCYVGCTLISPSLSLSPSLISLNVIHSFILLYQLCYTN